MYALFVHEALDLGNPRCKGPSAQNHKRVALDLADCKADITIMTRVNCRVTVLSASNDLHTNTAVTGLLETPPPMILT
jgi:hypothetical protein